MWSRCFSATTEMFFAKQIVAFPQGEDQALSWTFHSIFHKAPELYPHPLTLTFCCSGRRTVSLMKITNGIFLLPVPRRPSQGHQTFDLPTFIEMIRSQWLWYMIIIYQFRKYFYLHNSDSWWIFVEKDNNIHISFFFIVCLYKIIPDSTMIKSLRASILINFYYKIFINMKMELPVSSNFSLVIAFSTWQRYISWDCSNITKCTLLSPAWI